MVISDGEATILWESIDPEVTEGFSNANASMNKSGPSATTMEQACDAGTEFKDLKRGVLKVQEDEVDTRNDILRNGLKAYWKDWDLDMKANFPLYNSNPTPLSKGERDKIQLGLEVIVYVMQNDGYTTPQKSRQGFKLCGMHTNEVLDNPILGYENSSIDFDRIMAHCYQLIDIDTIDFIKLNVPELIPIMRQNGKLIRKDYENVGIYQRLVAKGFTMLERDDKVIWQQHAQSMSNPNNLAVLTAYKAGRDPVELARQREIERDIRARQKLIDDELIAAQKLILQDDRINAKREAVATEKRRISLLSREELSEHRAAQKALKVERAATSLTEKLDKQRRVGEAKAKIANLDIAMNA